MDSSTSCCRAVMKLETRSSHVKCRQLLLASYLHVAFILAWEKVCGNKCNSKRVWITFVVNFSLCHFVWSIINAAFELMREEKIFHLFRVRLMKFLLKSFTAWLPSDSYFYHPVTLGLISPILFVSHLTSSGRLKWIGSVLPLQWYQYVKSLNFSWRQIHLNEKFEPVFGTLSDGIGQSLQLLPHIH